MTATLIAVWSTENDSFQKFFSHFFFILTSTLCVGARPKCIRIHSKHSRDAKRNKKSYLKTWEKLIGEA